MCDYCEKEKKLRSIDWEHYKFEEDFITISGNTLHIEALAACGWENGIAEEEYRINYCPMCGRKLEAKCNDTEI